LFTNNDCDWMKTFRELISWELEQEKNQGRSVQLSTEDGAGKLSACLLRKLRYLSATRAQVPGPSGIRPA
jgi:hypothetical protein